MSRRFYLATKGNNTVKVELNLLGDKPRAIGGTFKTNNTETKFSQIESLLLVMREVDFEELLEPAEFFVNDGLANHIKEGHYKHWLLSGVRKTTGEEVTDVELQMWQELHDLMVANSLKVIIHSTKDHRLSESLKQMNGKYSPKQRRIITLSQTQLNNDKYIDLAWEQLKSMSNVPDVDESELAF